MYERMTDKLTEPTDELICETLGCEESALLHLFELFLYAHYDLIRELKFPFGGNYGWGYKYSHKSKHLCYAFFEQKAFTVTIQLGDKEASAAELKTEDLLPKTKELWCNRYPCGKFGGWVHYRVLNQEELNDVIELVKIKKSPMKKIK